MHNLQDFKIFMRKYFPPTLDQELFKYSYQVEDICNVFTPSSITSTSGDI